MMTDPEERLPKIQTCYGTLPSMLRKFDRFARRDYFRGHSAEEFEKKGTHTSFRTFRTGKNGSL